MIPKHVEDFRTQYREKEIGPHYSGWGHFSFTLFGTLIPIVVAILLVRKPTLRELMTVPITFLYANCVEYFFHKGPMHQEIRFLKIVFQRHTGEHHRFYTHDAMDALSTRDYKMVLFPPEMLVLFITGFSIPVAALLYFVLTPNVAFIFTATALGYFLNYEVFHWAYHQPETSWVRRVPGVNRLRTLHTTHHNPALMTQYCFNITYPICDRIFGTYRPPR